MTKTIKLSEESYTALENLREKRETFDEAFRRLLHVYRTVADIRDNLPPGSWPTARPIKKEVE